MSKKNIATAIVLAILLGFILSACDFLFPKSIDSIEVFTDGDRNYIKNLGDELEIFIVVYYSDGTNGRVYEGAEFSVVDESILTVNNWIITALSPGQTAIDVTYREEGDSISASLPMNVSGIGVTPETGLTTTESGGTAEFSVVLFTEPTAAVNVPVASTNTAEGQLSTDSLSFTTDNWDVPQIVTITGQNDDLIDGDQAYYVEIGQATQVPGSADYSGLTGLPVSVINTDDD
jgi:hypothetical protein